MQQCHAWKHIRKSVGVILDGATFYSLPEGSLDIAPDCRYSAGRIPALHILGCYVLLLQSHIQMLTTWLRSNYCTLSLLDGADSAMCKHNSRSAPRQSTEVVQVHERCSYGQIRVQCIHWALEEDTEFGKEGAKELTGSIFRMQHNYT